MPTIRVSSKTHKELLKMQAGYQLERGEKASLDTIIWTFIQNQPKIDLLKQPSKM